MKIVSIRKVTRILDSGIAIVRRDIYNCAVASHMQYVGVDETMTKEEYANDVLQNIDRSINQAYLEFESDENLVLSEIEKKGDYIYCLTRGEFDPILRLNQQRKNRHDDDHAP